MNVTKEEIKYRQLQIEDYLQMISAEQKEYAEVYASSRITENNITNTDLSKDDLLEKILDRANLNEAFKKVKSNKGAGGIDEIGVGHLLPYLTENNEQLIQKIKDGKYRPNPVRRVEIPREEKGKVRKLGVPQGCSLSPLLSNIMLNELDHLGYKFVRYADDMMVLCKRKKSAERTLRNIAPFIEKKLFPYINHEKTEVAYIGKVKFWEFSFYKHKSDMRLRIHPKAIAKMKAKVNEHTTRNGRVN